MTILEFIKHVFNFSKYENSKKEDVKKSLKINISLFGYTIIIKRDERVNSSALSNRINKERAILPSKEGQEKAKQATKRIIESDYFPEWQAKVKAMKAIQVHNL